jgi:hypothetical protein
MLRNTLVFQLIFELAKLVCIALASTAGIIVGISIVLAIGMPIESWLFQLSGSLGAIGAMTTIFSVHQHETNGPQDYIDFLPGVGRKRGYWWTLNRLLAYWGALPGVIFGVLFGGIYALTVGEFFILPALTLVLTAMTVAGAFAHYHIRSRISWLPFE